MQSAFATLVIGAAGVLLMASTSMASVFEDTDVNAWLAPSYNYNFEGQHNGATALANRTSSHSETNTFVLDQVWISLDNAATEDSRGGAHVDYEWGNVNDAGAGGALYSAYASYLAPIHEGLQIDAGLIPTLIGAEVNQTNANYNVTRGLVWDWQPVTHVGAIVRGKVTDGWTAAIGVLNDPLANPPGIVDRNNEKAVTGQLGYIAPDWWATGTVVWGESTRDIEIGLYDVVIHCSGEDGRTTWINYTLRTADAGPNDGEIHGIAIARRMALTEDMGVSLRGEALIFDLDGSSTEQYSITATTDHAVTDRLTAKAEVRIDIDSDKRLRDSDGTRNEDVAAMFVGQLIYEF